VLAAAAAFQYAQAQFTAAQQRATAAQAALAQARAVDDQAKTNLRVAELGVDRARRELADVQARLVRKRTELGLLARNAYQESTPLAEWAIALDAQSPGDLAARLGFIQNISNIGNAILDDLQVARADLVAAQARLVAVREQSEQSRDQAAASLAAAMAAEAEARAAEQQLALTLGARQSAMAVAQQALAEDQRQYLALRVTSGRLATRIRELSATLAASKAPAHGTGSFVRPSTGPQTSPFGPRFHPILHYVRMHTGVDLGRGDGIVYAADDGVVLITEWNGGYGNLTVIDHGTIAGLKVVTLYGHQARFMVKPGDRVKKGQPIGIVGSTGLSTGPHVHFEVRIDGQPINPAPWLAKAPMPVSMAKPRS
jgi:murein DD-endopeptidase MepM/ murein hydrolase activator NlpD